MSHITLTVSVDEANLILEGLGQMPFARVYQLVSKLQDQAAPQLRDEPGAEVTRLEPPDAAAAD